MSGPQIRITVLDLETGESESQEIGDDYVLIAAGSCYVAHIQTYPKSDTHVLTVKGRRAAGRSAGPTEGAKDDVRAAASDRDDHAA